MKKAIPLLTALLIAAACGGGARESGMGEGMMADSATMEHPMESQGTMGDSSGTMMEDSAGMGGMMHDSGGVGRMMADTSHAGGRM